MVSFQAFFQGLGFGGKEAANMSMKMQGLSYDLASFFNIQDDNAQKRFLAALAGSPEVLDQFGINLKQAALQVELYDMGITSTVQNTDELTKTQGRLNIIMRAMSSNGILGDAQRTMNTWDNTVKRTFASLKTMGIAIGDFILPALKGFLEAVILVSNGVNDLLGISKKETELNQEKKAEYETLTRILLSTKKGTNSFKDALQDLTSKYPDFWKNVDATKISHEELAKAGRVADFLELGELFAKDALQREESCGGHFREEHITEDGEAKRDDKNFAYVAAWEYTGKPSEAILHKEELEFNDIELKTRSYK